MTTQGGDSEGTSFPGVERERGTDVIRLVDWGSRTSPVCRESASGRGDKGEEQLRTSAVTDSLPSRVSLVKAGLESVKLEYQ